MDVGGNVYVADTFNSTIRKVTSRGVVTTLAGQPGQVGSNDGFGQAARFNYPFSVAVDEAGVVYVADTSSSTIRRISPAGAVTTLAGVAGETGDADGGATIARFNYPHGIAVDGAGSICVADTFNHSIRKIDSKGLVQTLSPSDGGAVTQLDYVESIAVDDQGHVYAADSRDDSIQVRDSRAGWEGKKVEPSGRTSVALAGKEAPLEFGEIRDQTQGPGGTPPASPSVTPIPGATVYGTAPDGATLEWVEYPPTNGAPPRWPVVLIIHGGGFYEGTPISSPQSIRAGNDLAAAGYLALSITYRLAPSGQILNQTSDGRTPQQYNDCKMAARAARADPRCNGKLGVLGGSVGGTHAQWLALDHTTTSAPPWSEADRPDVVVSLSAISDFTDYRTGTWNINVARSEMTNYCNVPNTNTPTPENLVILQDNSPPSGWIVRSNRCSS